MYIFTRYLVSACIVNALMAVAERGEVNMSGSGVVRYLEKLAQTAHCKMDTFIISDNTFVSCRLRDAIRDNDAESLKNQISKCKSVANETDVVEINR